MSAWAMIILPMIFDLRVDGKQLFPHSEQYLHRVLIKLWSELSHCMANLDNITPPQQWLGASLGLGYDINPTSVEKPATVTRLFDWGRSAMESMEDHLALSEKEQHDRDKFWLEYYIALHRVCWEVGRYAFHRALSPAWTAVVFEIESSEGEICLMGILSDLSPCKERRVELCGPQGKDKENFELLVSIACDTTNKEHTDYEITIVRAKVARDGFLCGNNPKKPEVVIHCLAFERSKDARLYYESTILGSGKHRFGKSPVITLVGRAFAQPSRMFAPQTNIIQGPETFYISTSVLKLEDLQLPKTSVFQERYFWPDLRYSNHSSYADYANLDPYPQGLENVQSERERRLAISKKGTKL